MSCSRVSPGAVKKYHIREYKWEHIFRMGDTDIEEQLTELSKLLESGDDSEQEEFKDLLARHRDGREDQVKNEFNNLLGKLPTDSPIIKFKNLLSKVVVDAVTINNNFPVSLTSLYMFPGCHYKHCPWRNPDAKGR